MNEKNPIFLKKKHEQFLVYPILDDISFTYEKVMP